MSTRNLAEPVAPVTFPWRRVTCAVLVAAGVLALASLAGPTWVIRTGLVLGLAAGVVAAVLAIRAFRGLDEKHRESHGDQAVTLERAHGNELRQHRAQDTEVASVLRGHLRRRETENSELRGKLTRTRTVVEQQRTSLDRLHSEGVELRHALADSKHVISGLRQTLTIREEELAGLLGAPDDAEVYTMPRRVRSAERAVDPDPTELVDLATMQTATPPAAQLRQQA